MLSPELVGFWTHEDALERLEDASDEELFSILDEAGDEGKADECNNGIHCFMIDVDGNAGEFLETLKNDPPENALIDDDYLCIAIDRNGEIEVTGSLRLGKDAVAAFRELTSGTECEKNAGLIAEQAEKFVENSPRP